jgi:hypothetical protein
MSFYKGPDFIRHPLSHPSRRFNSAFAPTWHA